MKRFLLAVIITMATIGPARAGDKTGTRVTVNGRNLPHLLGQSPYRVRIVAYIDHPTDDWFCPEVTIMWSDGTPSGHLSDCDPLEDQERPLRAWISDEFVRYLGPGEHDITVRLKQGKLERKFNVQASIF